MIVKKLVISKINFSKCTKKFYIVLNTQLFFYLFFILKLFLLIKNLTVGLILLTATISVYYLKDIFKY